MAVDIKSRLYGLTECYLAVCLLLALFILTITGAGNVLMASMMGLILCMAGAMQRPVKADPWILLPLLLYNGISAASSWKTFGNLVDGYASTQMLLPLFYLLMASMEEKELILLRRLCAAWAGVVAAVGIAWFVYSAMAGDSGRLGGFLGNPNAMGSFLVIGWFTLEGCGASGSGQGRPSGSLPYMEPILLAATALTLSIGGMASLAAGILLLVFCKNRQAGFREAFAYACQLLSRVSLGLGIGLLLYLAADRTGKPWVCLPLLFYGAAAVACWKTFSSFLRAYPRMAAFLACLGAVVAAVAAAARPNAAETFTERLEMMKNGISYMGINPLLGVGPYQWRLLNLYDSDKYFNTYHIHNVFIHIGTELGLAAMAMLAVIAVRSFWKPKDAPQKAGLFAFLVHNLMDTSFFYLGITAFALLSAGEPKVGAKPVNGLVAKGIFAVSAAFFAGNLYCCLRLLQGG